MPTKPSHKIVGQRITLLLLGVMMQQHAYAIMPVIDAAAIAKLTEEITQLKNQVTLLQNQYNTAKSQLASLTGQRGWSQFSNSTQQITKQFGYQPHSWNAAMNGGSGSSEYNTNRQTYIQTHHVISQSQYEEGTNTTAANAYADNVKTTQAAAATSSTAYNELQTNQTEISKLITEIDDTKNNDVKSAIDLQSRLIGQVAYLEMQVVQLQSTLNEQMVAARASEESSQSVQAQYNIASEKAS